MSDFVVYALKDSGGAYYFVGKSLTGLRRPRQLKTGPCSKALREAIDSAGCFEIEILTELPSAKGLDEALAAATASLTSFGYKLVPNNSDDKRFKAMHRVWATKGDSQRAKIIGLIASNPKLTNKELAEHLGVCERQVKNHLQKLTQLGLVESIRSKEGRTLRMLE